MCARGNKVLAFHRMANIRTKTQGKRNIIGQFCFLSFLHQELEICLEIETLIILNFGFGLRKP